MTEGEGATDERVQEVLGVLLRLASADLDARVDNPEGDAPIELVAAAVNMLAEELAASVRSERELRGQLEAEIAERTAELEVLERAQALIRELSTPVIEVWAGVLVLPLIGVIDDERGLQVMEQLLHAIVERQAKFAIIDITGVPNIDASAADQLTRVVGATKMLGACTLLTGVGPRNAQTFADLDVDLRGVEMASSLRVGLQSALRALHR
jgi:rsbT co-antagonist protein RsbR